MDSADPFRVYFDPTEITPEGHKYGGYPLTWWGGYWKPASEISRDPTDTRTWVASVASAPGAPAIKDLVRERDGHRCLRCGHPYEKGMGEWSPCDVRCTHLGPVRMREVYRGDREWQEYDLTPVGMTAGEGIHDEGPGGLRMVRWEVEAQWRILTVHHLNGVKHDCRWWNLVSLCQRDHLVIQSKVVMERPFRDEHSEWFKPFAAGYYAWKYLGLELSQPETMARLEELLALEQTHTSQSLW